MRKQEAVSLVKYLYFTEARLLQAVNDCEYRYVRRELDEVDLLEEIIARSRLKCFYDLEADIIKILKMSYDSDTEQGE